MSTRDHNEGDPRLTERADIGEPGGPHTKPFHPHPMQTQMDELRTRMDAMQNQLDQIAAQPRVGNPRTEG